MSRTQALLSLLVAFCVALGGTGCGGKESQDASETMAMEDGPLLNPDHQEFQKQAPATFKVKFQTSAGDFTLDIVRAWSPAGVDRFYNLVRVGFFDDCRFFRIVPGFVAQFGMHGNPDVQQVWSTANIPDEPVKESNKPGYISYAKGGPNSRSTQLFINLRDNSQLDRMGFAPIGRVSEGMDVVDKLYSGYGDGPPSGSGPNQGQIMVEGNAYLNEKYPKLDYIKKATIVP
jgi:peptidyl-prolyl cis-trans isomerase A (cyclophilin A)